MNIIITGKTITYFQLKLKTNLHIGSGDSNIDTDALCIRNSEDNLIIPGTTLAGIFRSNLENLFDDFELIKNLFGDVDEKNHKSSASNIIFQDAVIQTDKEINSDIRDGIKINREYLSTEEGARYDKETVFKESIFQGFITIAKTNKNRDDFSKYLGLLKIVFYNLDEGIISIGGSSSRGLGQCTIENCLVSEFDFTKPEDFKAFLLGDFYDYDFEQIKKEYQNYLKDLDFKVFFTDLPPISKNHMMIKIDYSIKTIEPLLINGPRTNDEEVDLNFVKTNNKYFIPGSSVKGPIRNRAEMILETLGVKDSKKLTDQLFGSTEGKSKIQICDLFPEGELEMKRFDHNKIDRFTGGAIENALFNEKLIFDGKFYGKIFIDNPNWKEIKLLMQIFKDLYLEDIRIGYGKRKGYGKVIGEIINLKIYAINKPMIGNENLTDYGFRFSKGKNIYQIWEIEDKYLAENLEKYNKFRKKMDEYKDV